jgi:CO/xanthine dehydrogenase Mo-binding subunit
MPNASLTKQPNLDQWLSIGTDGRVLLRTGKVDIGQRISTALMLIAADELDIDPARIDIATVETGVAPDEGITSGSNSMEESGDAVRRATATARKHLLALAARHLDSEQDALEIVDGLIRARATNRSVSYWELAGGKPFGIPVDQMIRGKDPKTFRHVGKPATARGMADLVAGSATYVHDMTLPGMLHARVIRPPHYHAKLASLDESKAGTGLAVARDGSFIAVTGADGYAIVRAGARSSAAARLHVGEGLDHVELITSITSKKR